MTVIEEGEENLFDDCCCCIFCCCLVRSDRFLLHECCVDLDGIVQVVVVVDVDAVVVVIVSFASELLAAFFDLSCVLIIT
jgi:hypothetical protein